jgi:hypothetical protein
MNGWEFKPFMIGYCWAIGLVIILILGIWAFTGISKDYSEVVQIEMRPKSPPQPRPGPYEFEFKRAEELWDRDHIAYVPDRHHVRRSHKLTHEAANACYDKDGKQITPIPKGCTDLFIERDK